MKKTAALEKERPLTTSDTKRNVTDAPKLHVGREIADTTWRMTVPVVIFAFIGIYADVKMGTEPWITFLGVIIGFYFAYVLVKKQISRSEDSK